MQPPSSVFLLLYPIANGLQCQGSNRFLDGFVLAERSALRGLKQMVQSRQLNNCYLVITSLVETLFDLGQIQLRINLSVLLSVDGQYRASDFLKHWAGFVRQKEAKPSCVHCFQVGLDERSDSNPSSVGFVRLVPGYFSYGIFFSVRH